MRMTTRLRQLIAAPDLLMLPGAHDALSAKLAEEAGFDAILIGGLPATGSLLAEPDTSQLGLSELAEHYRRAVTAIDIPVFVDGDTGFGNAVNARRTTREFERAGVAGFFIEDQVFPKRCGHTPGKAVVPAADMIAKLKAALDARVDADLVIMARTDALAVEGLDAAIERANLYREAGADVTFVEAPRTVEEMRRITAETEGPKFANMLSFGVSPELTAAQLQEIGFSVACWGMTSLFAMVHAVRAAYADLKAHGRESASREAMVTFDEYNALVGLPELRALEDDCATFAETLVEKDDGGARSGATAPGNP